MSSERSSSVRGRSVGDIPYPADLISVKRGANVRERKWKKDRRIIQNSKTSPWEKRVEQLDDEE